MKIKDLLDRCYEVFYEDIIIGTEETTLWIYSYQEEIPEEVLRLTLGKWNGDPCYHLIIYI